MTDPVTGRPEPGAALVPESEPAPAPAPVITARDVVVRYGATTAVDGISLTVERGEILGLIGPNGAGKTTFVESLEGLRRRDSGTVSVLGRDPAQADSAFYRSVGVQLQAAALVPGLRVGETVRLFASFFDDPRDPAELLATLGLTGLERRRVDRLSGGQRQRVLIATALVGRPDLVFLDELTTGLDPQTRIAMWDVVEDIRAAGATVVLTTHFMEEAHHLCDRVAVIDHGRVIALGTVSELVSRYAPHTLITFVDEGDAPLGALEAVPGVTAVRRDGRTVHVEADSDAATRHVVAALAQEGISFSELSVQPGTLEDVFLALTGRAMREEAA